MTNALSNNNRMTDITDADYDDLIVRLADQIAALMDTHEHDDINPEPGHERQDAALNMLVQEFQFYLTPRQWLDVAGKRLNLDTSGCVGV